MNNLRINVRFGTWFFQVTKNWQCSFEQSEHWLGILERDGTLKNHRFGIYKLSFWRM